MNVVVVVAVAFGHIDSGVLVIVAGDQRVLEAEMARILVKHLHIVAVKAGIRAVVDRDRSLYYSLAVGRSFSYSLVVDIGYMGPI